MKWGKRHNYLQQQHLESRAPQFVGYLSLHGQHEFSDDSDVPVDWVLQLMVLIDEMKSDRFELDMPFVIIATMNYI